MQKDRDISFDAFRGIAIIAVVAIYAVRFGFSWRDSPTGQWNFLFLVGYQQLLNFAVPAFLFISGYWLSKKPIKSLEDYKTFLIRRFSRILIPYLLWSFILTGYVVVKTNDIDISVYGIILRLLTGGAAWGYYFIIVIAQLYILTPLLQYINRKSYGLILVLTLNIISLLALYLSRVFNIICHLPATLPFYSWIIFYEIGLLVGSSDNKIFATKKVRLFILPAILVCLLISELEGMLLLSGYSNLEFAISVIKYSSFLYSVCIIFGFLFLREHLPHFPRFLVVLGNYSFGVYLMHMIFLPPIAKVVQQSPIIYSFQPLYQFIVVTLTMLTCLVVIDITRRLLPRPFCVKVLGF